VAREGRSVRGRFGQAKRLAAPIFLLTVAIAVAACATTADQAAADGDVEIVARDMAFMPSRLTVTAGQPFNLKLINEDEAPHNVAIFVDSSASESLFTGELITNSAVTYAVPALAPGTYFFHCDLHPEMTGTLVVED
jgi:plastocyanin